MSVDLARVKERVDYALAVGKNEAALEILRETLREASDVPYFWTSMALAYYNMNRLDEAEEAIYSSLRVDPEFFWTHGAHGLILEARGKLDKAEESYKTGLSLNPESNMVLYNYADFLYRHRKDYEGSEAYTRQLLNLSPEHIDAYILLGRIRTAKDDSSGAAEIYTQALRLDAENAEAHYLLGVTELYDKHDAKRGFEHLRTAMRLNPESASIREHFFQALKSKNKFYGLFWQWSLLLGRLGKYRWAFVIGLWLGIRILSKSAKYNPEIMPYVLPIVIIYILFALYTWLAEPIFNLLIKRGWLR